MKFNVSIIFIICIVALQSCSKRQPYLEIPKPENCNCAKDQFKRFPKIYDRYAPVKTVPGFLWFQDGKECAAQLGKPHLLVFDGWAAVGCRGYYQQGYLNPKVQKLIKEAFVVSYLLCDDKIANLTPKEWTIDHILKDTLKTLGEVNAHFEAVKFQRNSQPYFVILDGDERILNVSSM